MNLRRIKYGLKSFINKFDNIHNNCPSCGSKNFTTISSKEFNKYPTSLRHCSKCKLLYRHPTTLQNESKKFYEDEYSQVGLTTDLPNESQLKQLIDKKFRNSEKDFSKWFPVFRCISKLLDKKISVLDYGANWGYTVFQLDDQEFIQEVYGYEYSDSRRYFGEKNLNVKYINEDQFINKFDVVFSSHVIEHMFNPSLFKIHMDQLLLENGYCIIICPNGSLTELINNPNDWRTLWSMVHPNLISDEFLLKLFKDYEGGVFPEIENEIAKINFLNRIYNPPVSYLPSSFNLIALFKKISAE